MLIDKKTYWFCKAGSRKRFRLVFSQENRREDVNTRHGQQSETFSFPHLRAALTCATVLKHPRVARPASWQIGLAPIGVADAAVVHRIFPYNLISDALRMAAHASLLPICAFPIAS